MQIDIQILIEVKLVSIRSLGLESSIVFFVLCYYIGFVGEETRRLQIQDETSEMRRRDEVLYLVVVLKGVFVHEEFVCLVHTAQGHIATELGHSHRIVRSCREQSFPFDLDPHGGDIFYEQSHKLLHIRLGLIRRDRQQRH